MENTLNANVRPELSLVLPVFKESEATKKLVPELMAELSKLGMSYEVIYVNLYVKGDPTYDVLKGFADKYDNFFPINIKYLKTNSKTQKGEQYRIGFELARGKYIIQMDTDYQDNPADLPKFIEKLKEGYDLVVGWKQNRKDGKFYMLTSWGQNLVTRLLSGITVHDKNCGFKGYSRAALKSVRLYGLNFRNIPVQLKSRGFSITEVPIDNRKRDTGKNHFNFKSRLMGGTIDLFCDLVLSKMEDTPFRYWGVNAFFTDVLGFFLLLLYIGENVFNIINRPWVSSLLLMFAGISFISSILFILTGLILQYSVDQRSFDLRSYHIEGDCKGIIKRLEQN